MTIIDRFHCTNDASVLGLPHRCAKLAAAAVRCNVSCAGVGRYKVCSTVSQRVGRLNPAWNDTAKSADVSYTLTLTDQ